MPDGSHDARRRNFNGETRAQAMADGWTLSNILDALASGEAIESPAGCLFTVPPIATKLEADAYKIEPSKVRALSPEARAHLTAWQRRFAASCTRAKAKHDPAPSKQARAIKARNAAVSKYLTGGAPKRATLPALPVVPVTHAGEAPDLVLETTVRVARPRGSDLPEWETVRTDHGACDVYRYGETGQIRLKVGADRSVIGMISGKVARAKRAVVTEDDAPVAPVEATPPTPAEIEASMILSWEAADAALAPDAPVEAPRAPVATPEAVAPTVRAGESRDAFLARMLAVWSEQQTVPVEAPVEREPITVEIPEAAVLAYLQEHDGNEVSRAMALAWCAADAAEGRA